MIYNHHFILGLPLRRQGTRTFLDYPSCCSNCSQTQGGKSKATESRDFHWSWPWDWIRTPTAMPSFSQQYRTKGWSYFGKAKLGGFLRACFKATKASSHSGVHFYSAALVRWNKGLEKLANNENWMRQSFADPQNERNCFTLVRLGVSWIGIIPPLRCLLWNIIQCCSGYKNKGESW